MSITLLEALHKSKGTSDYERVNVCVTDFQMRHRVMLKFGDWMHKHTLW
jgi:hypothetical protein